MIVQGRHRQVLVDPLADVEGRHQVQDQADHHAEGAQVDHGAVEPVAAAAQLHEVAVRGDQGQAGHGRGQVLVGDAGAVGGRGGGAGHRDVRQRGQVAQREAVCVQAGGQLGVAQARGHPGHAGGRVDRDLRRQAGQADLGARGIGQVVERMAGGQHADPAAARHDGLELGNRGRAEKARGAEGDVAGPVRPQWLVHPRLLGRTSARVFPHPPVDPPVPTATLPAGTAQSREGSGGPGNPAFPPVPQRFAQSRRIC